MSSPGTAGHAVVVDPPCDPPCPVVVADDHRVAREALCSVVATTPGLELVAAVDSGEGAEAYAGAAPRPLLVVMDVRMPGMGGLEAARQIVARGAGHVVVLVSADEEPDRSPTDARATTFLAKSRVTGPRLIQAWELGRRP
jgi:DNA-binding NarL/FixJ family response regulator